VQITIATLVAERGGVALTQDRVRGGQGLRHHLSVIRQTYVIESWGFKVSRLKRLVIRFLTENKGVTAIEYGLIAGVVAIAIATAAGSVGTNLSGLFNAIAGVIQANTPKS
jgi:pilus assembly protein Flp/PilA